MNIHFTDEQELMYQMVSDFASHDVKQAVPQMEQDEFPIKLVRKMGKLGLMGIPIPDEYGGSGMDFTSYIIAIHQLSKVSATLGAILSVHTSVGTNPIRYYGNEKQKEFYLPKLASGTYLGAFALTEPNAGSDAKTIRTKAVKKGENYILNGTKAFITNSGVADTYITFARTNDQDGADGISAFIVEKGMKGLHVGKPEKKMGLHGSNTATLTFENCVIPQTQMLGKEGEGFAIAMSNLNVGRIGIAAQGLGIAEQALTYATDYAKKRQQFGKPIAQHQAISFKLADMATEVEASRLLVYRAASLVERGILCNKEASMAKVFASRTARKVTIEAVQIFGGNGYTTDYPIERLFRDAKITEIYEGTNEIQRIVIARHLLHD